ncbi:MAG: carboxypeptidase regulatory-like domain-containing protein [Ilumatobacter sp.]|nr:carboxypeptidase regulatory-like domain-containing protein [Ilumatobacter sp.]
MRTELALSHVRALPGTTATVEVEITNDEVAIDGVTVLVDGINPEWVRLERPLVSLFPEASDSLVVHFDIPTYCQAGDYLIDLRVVSAVDNTRETSHDFWLIVEPKADLDLEIRPSVIRCGSRGVVTAAVRNTGNCPIEVELTSEEPSREVNTAIVPPVVGLAYGAETLVEIDLRGRRPLFGEYATRPVIVRARTGDRVVERNVTFIQKPRIPRGAGTALILAAIVALWAVIFLWVVSAIRSGGDPPKAVPIEEVDGQPEILVGAANIELSLIRGTVEGTVTASTNGDGIPSVTVEAFRIKTFPKVPGEPDPQPPTALVAVASGATDADGSYSLRTLIPGDYVLRFSEPGYGEVWYPGTLSSGQSLDIRPRQPDRGNDVVMEGVRGSVSVQLDLPDGVDPSALTARIASRDSITPTITGFRGVMADDDGTAASAGTCTVSPTGLVTCDGVPTPGEYTITVSGPGFDTQRIDVALDGGDDTVVDTVQLSGEPGGITGSVIDQDGAAIVGARVTISSGLYTVRVFTDRGGRFTVADLPTPADYVVDIAESGYVGRTVAIPLEPGTTQTLPPQRLVGGVGTITGEVVDGNGARLPGVEVQVSGNGSAARTTTLTDGATGSFLLRDLDVPGTYSVTFSLAGYITETRLVTFEGAGEQSVGAVAMATSYGAVEGTVVDPAGNVVANAKVELLDGVRTRTTTTSTSGGGAFAFANVAPGPYTIVVTSQSGSSTDVAMWVAQRNVGAGETVRLDRLVLPVGGLGTIKGVVTGLQNERLGQVGITVSNVAGGASKTTSTGTGGVSAGTYSVAGLDVPGTYLVSYTLANYAPHTEQIELDFTSGGNIATRNVALSPNPGRVAGSVRSSIGAVMPGASVELTDSAGASFTTTTDASGNFSFASVAAGTAVIEVTSAPGPSAGSRTTSYVVPAGGGTIPDPILVDLVTVTTTTTAAPTTTTTIAPTTTTTIATGGTGP